MSEERLENKSVLRKKALHLGQEAKGDKETEIWKEIGREIRDKYRDRKVDRSCRVGLWEWRWVGRWGLELRRKKKEEWIIKIKKQKGDRIVKWEDIIPQPRRSRMSLKSPTFSACYTNVIPLSYMIEEALVRYLELQQFVILQGVVVRSFKGVMGSSCWGLRNCQELDFDFSSFPLTFLSDWERQRESGG